MSQSRQLAAIMFTDIVGYTAMMEEDEMAAMNCRQKLKQKLEEVVAAHQGTIIEFRGDGGMCSFTSTIQGVKAALTLQLDMQTSPVVPLRIGMHTGDVIFEGNNIYGDGVNIASRMESFAIPGSIFISAKVYDDIKNQKDIQTISLGKYALKNVKEQVEIFAVSNPGIIVPGNNSLEGKGEKVPEKKITEKSIAVLPFKNMSNDPEQEYFSDGIAEEIINSLVHLKDLKVAGRTSSFQFKGKNIDLRELGKKLGVNTVLEGSIRKQGNRLRITAQLINVEDGFHFWSEKYDREMDDIFAIQDEIALSITEHLKITLFDKDRELVTKTHTQNAEAYELYLKGRFHLNRRGSSIITGMQYLEEAVKIDPEFAMAYAGYADANILSAFYSLKSGKEVIDKVKTSAEKAIELDPTLCEPYASLGFYYTALDWDWEKAKQYFDKSLEINPDYVFGNYSYGLYYHAWAKGDYEEAEKLGCRALKLEPLSSIVHAVHALILATAGKFEEAISVSRAGIELDSNSFLCYRGLTNASISLKKYKQAIDAAEYLIKISNRHQHAVTDLLIVYSRMGDIKKAKILYEELQERSGKEFMASGYMALSAASVGNMEEAYTYFEKAIYEHDPMLITFRYMDYTSFLQDDVRYREILKIVGFD